MILWMSFLKQEYVGKEVLRMMPDETIKNPSELEFVIFCIENVAEKIRQIMILLWVVLPMIRYSIRWNYFLMD